MLTGDLLTYLFDEKPHLLAQPMATWLTTSRRFATFATTFRDKIRKKLRTTHDPEGLLDLRLELETAYLLLQERSLSLAYEPEQSKRIRSPDFAVTFTISLTFMVEVTRVQAEAISPVSERLADSISSKLGQLLAQRSNILLVGVESLNFAPSDIPAAMLNIQQRAERNDSAFLQRHGFRVRADFFRHFQCLSEILARRTQPEAAKSIVTWVNPQAKYPLPSKVRTALYRSHTT